MRVSSLGQSVGSDCIEGEDVITCFYDEFGAGYDPGIPWEGPPNLGIDPNVDYGPPNLGIDPNVVYGPPQPGILSRAGNLLGDLFNAAANDLAKAVNDSLKGTGSGSGSGGGGPSGGGSGGGQPQQAASSAAAQSPWLIPVLIGGAFLLLTRQGKGNEL